MANVQERDETQVVEGTAAAAPAETALAPTEKADRPMTRTGAMGFGLAPRNFDEAWRMAGVFAKSGLVPKGYVGKPEDILVAMACGAEIGLPPMAALQSIAVVNGKPGLYGDGFLGVIMSTPAYQRHEEYYVLADGSTADSLAEEDYKSDLTKAVSKFWRRGNPKPFVAEFSISDAKRAQLWGKDSPWRTAPARMLLWRARGFAGRNGFAAELRGIKTAEELFDTPEDPEISVEPINGPPAEPVRRSEKALTAAAEPPASNVEPPTSDVEPATGSSNGGTAPAAREPRATATAESKPDAAPAGPGQVSKNVHISDTTYVGKPKNGGAAYWEVKGEEIGPNGKPKLGHTWITRDEQLFRMAASCEGSDSLFTVIWHTERQGTAAVKVITGLQGS